MNVLVWYLIIINTIGFALPAVNRWLHLKTVGDRAENILIIASLLGGSLGILISVLLFDRKAVKDNMMPRVFVGCAFVIQMVVLLFVCGNHGEKIDFAFWEFFAKHKILLIYLGIVNFAALVAFAVDKIKAVRKRSRIKIATLLGLCFIGGSVGGLCGMYLFRHKTKKNYFTVGVPLMILMQIAVLFYLMNI